MVRKRVGNVSVGIRHIYSFIHIFQIISLVHHHIPLYLISFKIENEINEVMSEESVLVWYVEGHLQATSSKIPRSVTHITETFPAYVVIERANRLSSDST